MFEYSFALEFSGRMCVRVIIGEHFAFMYLEFLAGFILHIKHDSPDKCDTLYAHLWIEFDLARIKL